MLAVYCYKLNKMRCVRDMGISWIPSREVEANKNLKDGLRIDIISI